MHPPPWACRQAGAKARGCVRLATSRVGIASSSTTTWMSSETTRLDECYAHPHHLSPPRCKGASSVCRPLPDQSDAPSRLHVAKASVSKQRRRPNTANCAHTQAPLETRLNYYLQPPTQIERSPSHVHASSLGILRPSGMEHFESKYVGYTIIHPLPRPTSLGINPAIADPVIQ